MSPEAYTICTTALGSLAEQLNSLEASDVTDVGVAIVIFPRSLDGAIQSFATLPADRMRHVFEALVEEIDTNAAGGPLQ